MTFAIIVSKNYSRIKQTIFQLCEVEISEPSLKDIIELSGAKYIEINDCNKSLVFLQSTTEKLIGGE